MENNLEHKKVSWECRFFTKSSSEYLDFIPESVIVKSKKCEFIFNLDKYIYIKNSNDVVKFRDNKSLQIKELIFSDYMYHKFGEKIEIKFPINDEDQKKAERLKIFLKKYVGDSSLAKCFNKKKIPSAEDFISLLKELEIKFKVVDVYKQRLKFDMANDFVFEVAMLKVKDKHFKSFCFEGNEFNKLETEIKHLGIFDRDKLNLDDFIKFEHNIVFGYATFLKWLDTCPI
ncbi:MAG: hypothetical protein K2X39_07140 [Silvanigrellaceae bacterium]|nr:hypothetical protein [Silvanigrellaceae bacterium]